MYIVIFHKPFELTSSLSILHRNLLNIRLFILLNTNNLVLVPLFSFDFAPVQSGTFCPTGKSWPHLPRAGQASSVLDIISDIPEVKMLPKSIKHCSWFLNVKKASISESRLGKDFFIDVWTFLFFWCISPSFKNWFSCSSKNLSVAIVTVPSSTEFIRLSRNDSTLIMTIPQLSLCLINSSLLPELLP